METIRRLNVDADGTVSDLNVIGIHGFLDDRLTPTRREPVYQTVDGHFARIIRRTDDGKVEVSVSAKVFEGGELPGDGTRVGPWPARLGYEVVAIGTYERLCAEELDRLAGRTAVIQIFEWLLNFENNNPPFGQLITATPDGIVWYALAADADDMFRAICKFGALVVIDAVLEKQEDILKNMSWWLSRASVSNGPMYLDKSVEKFVYLAVAGLKRAGVGCWKQVLEFGIGECYTEQAREEGLARAENVLNYLSQIVEKR